MLLSEDQEHATVGVVIADNAIKLREIQTTIVEDSLVFHSVDSISLTTTARTLTKHRVRMKQLYTVPFERSSEWVKELQHKYVQVWCLSNMSRSIVSFTLCYSTCKHRLQYIQ